MKKTRIGAVIGDFKIIERIDKSHYRVQCVNCGLIRKYSNSSITGGPMKCICNRSKKKKCPVCGKEFITANNARFCSKSCGQKFYKENGKTITYSGKRNPLRTITKTTKMLVCVYTYEGMSIKDISSVLKRPKEVIENILYECRKNGKYDFFISNSPSCQRRKKCTLRKPVK